MVFCEKMLSQQRDSHFLADVLLVFAEITETLLPCDTVANDTQTKIYTRDSNHNF